MIPNVIPAKAGIQVSPGVVAPAQTLAGWRRHASLRAWAWIRMTGDGWQSQASLRAWGWIAASMILFAFLFRFFKNNLLMNGSIQDKLK